MTANNDRYPNVETGRWIVEISRDGAILVLDDGSRWQVAPTHRLVAQNWHRTLVLHATQVQGLTYDLRSDSEQSVLATFLGVGSLPERPAAPRANDAIRSVDRTGARIRSQAQSRKA